MSYLAMSELVGLATISQGQLMTSNDRKGRETSVFCVLQTLMALGQDPVPPFGTWELSYCYVTVLLL